MIKKAELTKEAMIREELNDLSGNELLNPERIVRWERFERESANSILFMARGNQDNQAKVRITFYTESIIRVQGTFGKRFDDPDEIHPLIKLKAQSLKLSLKEDRERLVVNCGKISLEMERKPWQLSVFNKSRLICREQPFATNQVDEYISLVMGRGKRKTDGAVCLTDSFEINPEEGIFGFGERFDHLDKRGAVITTLVQAPFASNPKVSYKPTPFFFSSRGYGIYVHTFEPVVFDLGNRSYEALSFTHPGETIDYFLIIGDSPAAIIRAYHQITGLPVIPPAWSFGYMQSSAYFRRRKGAVLCGYMTQKEVIRVAKRLRAERIPCDGITLDTTWSGNYGLSPEKVFDWKFCLKRFPDPEKMTAELRSTGFHLCVTQWPYLMKCFNDFAGLKKKGFLVKNYHGGLGSVEELEGLYFLDLTNPGAYTWLKERNREILRSGVSALMADFCEDYPLDGKYYSGINGRQARNLMPLLYQKALYEAARENMPEKGCLWARAGFTGMQLTPGHWAGDNHSSFQSLAAVVRAGLNFGISGGVCWGHDIGGWFGQCDFKPDGTPQWTAPSEELFIRWLQFGFFSTWVRAHGGTPREPWVFGKRTLKIFRHYARFRARLIPYIYSCALEAKEGGIPVMRAMFLDFPGDQNCWHLGQQYMFGPALLVAPICESGGKVKVYLPEGRWQDVWNKKMYIGPVWLNYQAPLEIIPVFQRGDTLLPLGPVRQHVGEKMAEPLELWAFVQKTAKFRLRGDEKDVVFTAKRQGKKLTVRATGDCSYKAVDDRGWL